jgi:NAD(P)-dependent dehydrogenase (short-subunit alcohol dehydrogenase family)
MSKVWLITGSGNGLGRNIAAAALAAGYNVVAGARRTEELEPLVKQYGGRVKPVTLEVREEAAAKGAAPLTVDTFPAARARRSSPITCTLFSLPDSRHSGVGASIVLVNGGLITCTLHLKTSTFTGHVASFLNTSFRRGVAAEDYCQVVSVALQELGRIRAKSLYQYAASN